MRIYIVMMGEKWQGGRVLLATHDKAAADKVFEETEILGCDWVALHVWENDKRMDTGNRYRSRS